MKTAIINGKVLLEDGQVEAAVIVEGDRILEVTRNVPEDCKLVDVQGAYVSPGFIDVHTHGRGGEDTMYATKESLEKMAKATLTTGVTSFLPTTMTNPIEETYKAIKNVHDHMHDIEGARIIGVHMEGPFLNPIYKGAQPESAIIKPTKENYKKLTGDYADIVKKMTIAPEVEGAVDFIRALSPDVVMSIGHTNATFDEAVAGYEAGARSTTHTYNAMTPLKHRDPGVVGLAMYNKDVYSELILDGMHVRFEAAKILYEAKGDHHLMLVTDSCEAATMPEGEYRLGGQTIYSKGGVARLADGTIAASIVPMNLSVHHAHEHFGIEMWQAARLASTNPADSQGREDLGRIKAGATADLAIFDEDVKIKAVMQDGVMKIWNF